MKKDLVYYLGLKYPVLLSEGEDSGETYVAAEIPELPGCGSYGKNRGEALRRLEEAKRDWISARLKRGLTVPEPVSEEDFSGKFLLRIPPDLHRKLVQGAKTKNLSLNQFIRNLLEESMSLGMILDKLADLDHKMADLARAMESPEHGPVANAEGNIHQLWRRLFEFNSAHSSTWSDLYTQEIISNRPTYLSHLETR